MGSHEDIIEKIRKCNEPDKLSSWRENALRAGADDVADAAFRQLIKVLPSAAPGTLEHALWQTIHSFEAVLTEERGKTTRLARTRQKIARVGEKQTLIDWALSKTRSEGFAMLRERGMLELVGEAIVLRFAHEFDPAVVAAAKQCFRVEGLNEAQIASIAAPLT